MEGQESMLLRNDQSLGLRLYGGRFFQAAYTARSEENGMSKVLFRFEEELAHILISIFEHFLRRRIHENDVTVLLGQLVNDSHRKIMEGVNVAREIQFQEIQDVLSPAFRPTIEQSLSQTVGQVRLTVWKMLAILGAKGGDAALAHIDRLRRELLQKFSEQEEMLAQAKAGQKRMTKLLQDFLIRSGGHAKSLRSTIGTLQCELEALGKNNASLQQNLQRNMELLQGSRLQVEHLQGQYDGLLPRVNAYVAIEKSLSRAQMTLSGKTIAEKVERLLGELQRLQEVEAGKNNTASRLMQTEQTLLQLQQENNRLSTLIEDRGYYDEQIDFLRRMSQLDQEFYNGLAGLMGLFLENTEDTGVLYDAKEDFHKVFFLYHALHGNASEYAEKCIDQIKTKWKQDGNAMAIYLRPGVNIPDALVRTYIENAAISCRNFLRELFPKTQEGKSTKYTSPRPFGDTIDVVA